MKSFKIELPGGQLTEQVVDELRSQMEEAVREAPESKRAAAREAAEDLIGELRARGPALLSARSALTLLKDCSRQLDRLPETVRAIAQMLDSPSHIFALGGAASELIIVQGLLGSAADALREMLACDHCKAESEPSKERPS